MEWVGRKVFERGFWKSGEEKGDDSGAPKTSLSGSGSKLVSELVSRWMRLIRCGVNIAGAIDGFNWVEGSSD